MAEPKSFAELYQIYKDEMQANESQLTDFEEGAINDLQAGAAVTAVQEAQTLILDQFKKTFFDSADGPEITGGPDDLETLAIDHFGDDFARPAATKAEGIVTFSRPTAAAGEVLIPAGTVVKTPPNANGESQKFLTVIDVTMGAIALSVNASVENDTAGPKGNVEAGTITVIESTLTDPTITVTNALGTSGGEPEQDDATYRDTIKKLIVGLTGATLAAIEAKAEAVPGVEIATAKEELITVIEWNPATETEIGDDFKIARVKLFIADANGTANAALIDNVEAAVETVRAAGVKVQVVGATPVNLDWKASFTLNPSGPNFAELSVDPTMVEDSMRDYIENFAIGEDFDRFAARAAILAIWGPTGSDDLTDFQTLVPTGNVEADENEKFVAGTIEIV